MFKNYKNIFNQRGKYYHQAMLEFPLARAEEFENIINVAKIFSGNIICDVPSGGGYLNNFIKEKTKIISVETSQEFLKYCQNPNIHQTLICDNMSDIPLLSASVDRVISLAALHHESYKSAFYSESFRLLKKDGILCIADVLEGTGVADFLNIFVDQNNPMGHQGEFLNDNTKNEVESVGFQVEYSSLIRFYWKFDSLESMVQFCKLLFYINCANNTQILEAIKKYLGYKTVDNQYYLNWELLFLRALK